MSPGNFCLRAPPLGFGAGYSRITPAGPSDPPDAAADTGMEFGLAHHAANDTDVETSVLESVWVLLRGAVDLEVAGIRTRVERRSVFDEPPTALHVPRDTRVTLRSRAPTEWAG